MIFPQCRSNRNLLVPGKPIPFMWDPANYADLHANGVDHNRRTLEQVHPLQLQSVATSRENGEAPPLPEDAISQELAAITKSESVLRRQPTIVRRLVMQMVKNSPKRIQRATRAYSCTLITIFIFYSLPVLQLVMTYQVIYLGEWSTLKGHLDLKCNFCFYCSYRKRRYLLL